MVPASFQPMGFWTIETNAYFVPAYYHRVSNAFGRVPGFSTLLQQNYPTRISAFLLHIFESIRRFLGEKDFFCNEKSVKAQWSVTVAFKEEMHRGMGTHKEHLI